MTHGRTFTEKLRAALDERNMGARTLARAMVDRHGLLESEDRSARIDSHRRTIIRWLRGSTPHARNRELVEDALGMERDSLRCDDEEDDEALASLESVLRESIRVLVARELERRQ